MIVENVKHYPSILKVLSEERVNNVVKNVSVINWRKNEICIEGMAVTYTAALDE
ncbi:hypothetical protein [Fredinandcohnia onubensis]|uniref:hypothetical protein n=1 Tax=Fredinandcohnia onubensis TaxID=1571209 RepID=UPI0015D50595|nr:hypothetical protein [Fredinandcohnia onubensis]